ncbi:MAG: SDR family oxidoreductase [Phycisphaeraceae bacterium]|nr:SDR family oxidoreductase [Phycisphaeraceae bacterium]
MKDVRGQSLMGKVAVVTGGAIRVGRAICLALAREGMDIALTYRTSDEPAKQLVGELEALGRRATAISVDFNEPAPAAEIVHDAVDRAFGRVDVLVNNASVFDASPIGQITLEQLEHNFRVNAASPMLLIQKLAPLLRAHYQPDDPSTLGRVVNFIDIHVMGQPLSGYLPYNLSKAALLEVTHTAAMELAPAITVNAIAPGVVAWADSYTEQMKRNYMTRVPLARPGTPEDAAAAVRYLVRDAHYCTGQIIRLDGGRLLT